MEALPPDLSAEPEGFVVTVGAGERIHFLDWGGRGAGVGGAGGRGAGDGGARGHVASPVVLVHGIGQSGWIWTPVARQLVAFARVLAMDLRGHGLSDAPTEGYDETTLAEDVVAVADSVAELAGPAELDQRLVLAGHGLGAIAATWAAIRLGPRCRGLVLVDGGWEDIGRSSGMEVDEFLRTIEEPPEVYRSMRAFLADRRSWDPATWDADQDRAARATVVETPAGRVVPVTRPHVMAGMIGAMLSYDPSEVLPMIDAPIAALVAGPDGRGVERWGFDVVRRFPDVAHNLMRYRPSEVASTIAAMSGSDR